MVFGGIKIVPVYFANYQFQDAINSESRFALTGYPKRNAEDIRDDVFKKAQDLGIPAKREAIQVNWPTEAWISRSITPCRLIWAVYQLTPEFHPHADNHTI